MVRRTLTNKNTLLSTVLSLLMGEDQEEWTKSDTRLLELNLGCFSLLRCFNFEELSGFEIHHAGNNIRREHLCLVIVFQYGIIIVLPRKANLILS